MLIHAFAGPACATCCAQTLAAEENRCTRAYDRDRARVQLRSCSRNLHRCDATAADCSVCAAAPTLTIALQAAINERARFHLIAIRVVLLLADLGQASWLDLA